MMGGFLMFGGVNVFFFIKKEIGGRSIIGNLLGSLRMGFEGALVSR
jgi:hypothetical protein